MRTKYKTITLLLIKKKLKNKKVHERQTARMRTRSEWFLAGDGARGGSLELTSADIHLRPPSSIGGGSATAIGNITGGCGSYRSHDDLTNYRNDNFIIDNNNINSDFVVASSILSSSLSAFTTASTNVNNNNSNLHQSYHNRQNNNNHNFNHHHHHQRYHDNEHVHSSHHHHGGVVMMFFTVLDMLF